MVHPDSGVWTTSPQVTLDMCYEWLEIATGGSEAMEEITLDDTTSFPSAKPDSDVFGRQKYYGPRKRRGWYQVKHWPLVPHSGSIREHYDYATGADIPPELFEETLKLCFGENDLRGDFPWLTFLAFWS